MLTRTHFLVSRYPVVADDPSARAVITTAEAEPIPVAAMVESIVGCKWSVGLLLLLADGCSRPSAMLRALSGLSAKVLNERLRKMLRFGIISRSVFGDKPPFEVLYVITPFGRRFIGIIEEVRRLQEDVDRDALSEPCTEPQEGVPRVQSSSG